MKKAICLVLWGVLAMMTACTVGVNDGKRTDADSIYTYPYIKKIHLTDPQRALALTDTAEQKGIIGRDSSNWIRGIIHYEATKNYRQARDCAQQVLNHLEDQPTSALYLANTKLMAAICLTDEHYNESLGYCTKGAELAHEAGNVLLEADFNFQAGSCMERILYVIPLLHTNPWNRHHICMDFSLNKP